MFKNIKLLIATKHQKELVIAPLFEKQLEVQCFVNENFDTDLLGTFSGEIERKLNVIETLRQKCLLAVKDTDFDLVVASEGSFGSHPTLFFASADDEFLMFKDLKNDIEIVARHLSIDTNFDSCLVKNQENLEEFASKVKFPSHGIILKSSENNPEVILKDSESLSDLFNNYQILKQNFYGVFAETDMRANKNPTRMQVISETAQKLIEKITCLCPNCQFPGYEIKEVNAGLPCDLCGLKTKSTLSYTYGCSKCDFKQEEFYPLGKKTEDPTYCDFCNP